MNLNDNKKTSESYKLEKLGSICKWGSGGTPLKAKNEYYGGDIKWAIIGDLNGEVIYNTHFQITEKGLKESSAKLIPKNSLLIGMYGSIGKTAITGCDMATNQAIAFAIPKKNLNIWYLKYFIDYSVSELFKLSRGGTQKNINQEILKNFEIPFPAIEQQQEIVEEIEKQFTRLDKTINSLQNVKKKLETYRQSVLKSAFQGKLTINLFTEDATNLLIENLYHEKNTLIKNKVIRNEKKLLKINENEVQNLKISSKSFKLIRLGDIVSILGDGLHGTPNYVNFGDYAFINGNNLDNGKIKITSRTKFVDCDEYLKYKKNLNYNTVLVSINGTIGNVAFYNNEKVILGKSACYFNLFSNINKIYIKYLIKSKYFFNYASKNATGSTIKNVSLQTMKNFPVPICSLEEQQQIVNEIEKRFSVIEKVEQTVENSLRKAEQLKKSILKSAFEGRLIKQSIE